MANIDLNPTVSLADLRHIIPAIGETNTVLVLSTPGQAKTSMLNTFKEDLGKRFAAYVYLDAANLDVGDISSRIPVHAEKKMMQYVTDLVPFDKGPVMVMIDEIGKAPRIMQPMLTRLLLERYVGDMPLPAGSIVWATSNNASDGVGDIFPAHTLNRVTVVTLRNATNKEWAVWASNNGVHPMLRTWAVLNPRAFAHYAQGGQDDNVMIFNPRRPAQPFVSLRSLTKCNSIVSQRSTIGDTATYALLSGTVGQAAAKSIMTLFEVNNDVVDCADIFKDPDGCKIPESPAAIYMMLFNAVDAIETQAEMTAFMKYIKRMNSREVTGVLYTQLTENKRTAKIANNNGEINEWLQANYKVLV
jgi:hypothetical protein